MCAQKTYKVYAILNGFGQIRYIGRTSRKVKYRITDHLRCGEKNLRRWMRSLSNVSYTVLHETTNYIDSVKLEYESIQQHTKAGARLFNKNGAKIREPKTTRINPETGRRFAPTYASGRKRHHMRKVWLEPVRQEALLKMIEKDNQKAA